MKRNLSIYAWKCLFAALFSAACALAAALKPYQPRSTGMMLAALVLLGISLYYAEKHEQVKYGNA